MTSLSASSGREGIRARRPDDAQDDEAQCSSATRRSRARTAAPRSRATWAERCLRPALVVRRSVCRPERTRLCPLEGAADAAGSRSRPGSDAHHLARTATLLHGRGPWGRWRAEPLRRRDLREVDRVGATENGSGEVGCRHKGLGRLDERDERAACVERQLDLPVERRACCRRRCDRAFATSFSIVGSLPAGQPTWAATS